MPSKKKPNRLTKVLATIGPASTDKRIIQKMDESGVDLFRLNLSHTQAKDLPRLIKQIQSWTKKPLSLDSEGAQIRNGKMRGGKLEIKTHSLVSLVKASELGTETKIPLYPIDPAKTLQEGDLLYIDFGSVIVQVIQIKSGKVLARTLSGGVIGSNKGVATDRPIKLPPFTKKDLAAFKIGKKFKINNYALSFATSKEGVDRLRSFFPYPISLVSKIESMTGIRNLKEIAKASDAILIDRGDLSREVPIQEIALTQRHILNIGKETNTPVYVATNLLETMIHAGQPTRAEVNDITSTLMSGANGLVLAAETAVGKYPVESVRMIAGVIRETEDYLHRREKSQRYDGDLYDYSFTLVEPHGGKLVQNYADGAMQAQAKKLHKVDVSQEILLDVTQITDGVYSPIRGFMNKREMNSVLEDYRLPNGVVWTLPIIFQLPKKEISFKKGQRIALGRKGDKERYAVLEVSDIQKIDLEETAKRWFGTDSHVHPGVARIFKLGDYIVSGEVFLLKKPRLFPASYTLTPKQSRQIFKNFDWRTIVGFHTRNVPHRGHEFIQKEALKRVNADALFISPVVGPKKTGDFKPDAIVGAYQIMVENGVYEPYPVVVGAFQTYSRYSGPREAVFTALCRKNLGCSHFIIGRDHTGVGEFYAPDASQKIFYDLGIKDIGITPIMLEAANYCKLCKKVTDKCRHSVKSRTLISGTAARKHLLSGKKIPREIMRPEIADMLENWYKKSPTTLFEK
ncbi:MAG: sulfate adenylyltransferase [Candidatus Colwellbacteria bacterium]|nr:sulfate adenylyltransferase [Candidatus Colwellbacteria bacterium]